MTFTIVDAPPDNTPEQRPGDFRRDAKGTPWVADPSGAIVKSGPRKGLPLMTRYSRPSGFGELILDSYNLTKWGERMILGGIALGLGEPDERRLAKLLPIDNENKDWRKEADSLVKAAKDRARHMLAAERGTQAHELTERLDTERDPIVIIEAGEELGLTADVQQALLAEWSKMLDKYGLEILATELPVVHDGYRCAGTLDRIVRLTRTLTFVLEGGETVTLKAGTVVVLDLKTGKLRANNGLIEFWDNYPAQVAIYAGGVGYNVDTDERYDLPWTVDQDWAIIAHLDVLGAVAGEPSCELIAVDLRAGRHACDLVVAAKAYANDDQRFSLLGTCNVVGERPDPHRHANDFKPAGASVTVVAPDEGPEATETVIAPIRDRYKAASDVARKWIGELERDALHAHCGFHTVNGKTVRRLHIVDGLVALAAVDAMDEDLVKALVRRVTGDDAMQWATVTAGACVGSLDAMHAATFATACNAFCAGRYRLNVDLYGPRLEEAA